jgi:hypothetical protein
VGPQEWIAFGGLCIATIGMLSLMMSRQTANRDQILNRIAKNKEDLNKELVAIRDAAYEEYTILRKEISDSSSLAYREFGETVHGIREKVTQVELWIRDELKDTRHTLQGGMDVRHQIALDGIKEVDDRVRQLEIGRSSH